jgi:copper transport protein
MIGYAWLRRLALLAGVLAALLAAQDGVSAHASLVAADPADGSIAAAAPGRLTLRFNERVSPLVMNLVAPDGAALPADVTARDDTVTVVPRAQLGAGSYALSWRVISADGHPVGGTVVFSIGAPSLRGPTAGAIASGLPVRAAIWVTRVLLYLGLFVGAGGTVFAAWTAQRRKLPQSAQACLTLALWLGIAAAVLSVGLQGLDALAAPLSALASSAVWTEGFETSFGATAAIGIVALLAGLLSLKVRALWQARALSAVALVGVGLALAASGHASAASPQWLTRPAVFAHAVCIALWVGALLPLTLMLARAEAGAALAVRRFSFWILPTLALLVAAGVTLAVVQIGSVDALWSTTYGRIFLAKCATLVVLFGLAAVNRFRLTPALARGAAGARRGFARSIAAEGVLVLVILGLVATWRFTPPPRALAAAAVAAEPVFVHLHTLDGMAEITLTPREEGRTGASIVLETADLKPLAAKEVTVALSKPAAGIEPIVRAAHRVEGAWAIDDLVIPQPGRWHLRIDVLVSDFKKITLEDAIAIPP